MRIIQDIRTDVFPDDADLLPTKLVPTIHQSPATTRRNGLCGVRVWVKVPMVDGASLTFHVARRATPESRWETVLAGQAVSATVGGKLLKPGATPTAGAAADPIEFIVNAEYQLVIDEAIEGPWSYSLDLSA